MNREKLLMNTILAVVLITAGALASGITSPTFVNGETNKSATAASPTATVVRDSSAVFNKQ